LYSLSNNNVWQPGSAFPRNKQVIIIFFPLLLFFFSSVILPQKNNLFGHLSVENGLSNNTVNCVLQDHLGFLWFGTIDGLNRFDGYDIKVFRNDPEDNHSLSDNSVWSLYEDRMGFLWIGTNNGALNRYDPAADKFEYWNDKSNDLKENRITRIYEDKDGYLWVGTYKNGLYRFKSSTNPENPEHWYPEEGNPYSLSNYWITSIHQDISGDLWIGTYNGLNKFNPNSPDKPFIRFYSKANDYSTLSDNLIWNITPSEFEPEIVWLSTVNGLTRYNSVTKVFERIKVPDNTSLPWAKSTSSIAEQKTGNEKILWVGTYGGLLRINLLSGKYERIVKEDNSPDGIVSNKIDILFKDDSNVLWIATENGLNFISNKSRKFNNLQSSLIKKDDADKLKNKNIKAITQTSDGIVWIGTEEGLFKLKDLNENFTISSHQQTLKTDIWSLCDGNSNDLLIGTYGQGIMQLDIKTGRVRSLDVKNPVTQSLPYNFVKTIIKDSKGKYWFGFWGAGLARYDPLKNEFKFWQNESNNNQSLSYNDVWVIFEDYKNRIWIGTNGGGLNLFSNTGNDKFYCFSKDTQPARLSNNDIFTICESTKGKFKSSPNENSDKKVTTLWIGTANGLNKLTISGNKPGNNAVSNFPDYKAEIVYYTVKDGLPDNVIKSILEDEKGNLWIGTNTGISVFDIENNIFTNYTISDGLNRSEFNPNSAIRLSNGLMLFGGSRGLNVFRPDEIKQSEYSPPVLITGFQIFNQDIETGSESSLKTNIALTKEIILSYDQNVFSFQFSSLDYNSPQSNRYAYRMEGFDKDWVYSGSRRFVTYTNLEPGTYTFKVKATNSDGVWSKNEASLSVIITPPWWKTGWAYTSYFFLIVVALLGIRKFQKDRMELRNELKLRELEAKKHQELETLKSRFFANLSHEFRTPLMLIKGPLEQLIENQLKGNADEKIEQLKMIQRNSRKLQTLIDQLLELSQLDAASIPLKAKEENLISLLSGIVDSFKSFAEQKNIKLVFENTGKILYAWIDRDKFEKIINNLLSNAFKFTGDGGTISVFLTVNQIAEIKISDTGIGIPEDQLDKIFNRFFQVDDSSRRAFGGSGIGLALVKELVELHKWKITVQSEVKKGTTFTLSIPLGDSYLNENEKDLSITEINISDNNKTTPSEVIERNQTEVIKYPSKEITLNQQDEKNKSGIKHLVLIVEDSSDVRKYISGILEPAYNLIEAENGRKGLQISIDKIPDLIISDIMMPEMDGIEFCRSVKTNWETSHIPVILVTAKASSESKLEGLETGADDYLTKPFDSRELLIRVKNLLLQRQRLREKFSKEIRISAETLTTNSIDNDFLNRALIIAETNLSNTDFDSETFAKEMFVSRSQLHRKLLAITGHPPGEFMRIFRLKKSVEMILEKRLSITQIAFEVGFNDPSYFTKAFRQQFNCLPSDFIENVRHDHPRQ